MSIFNSENIENYCPKCCKIALFALEFLKFSGGACPRTPPEKFRLRRLRCPSPRKILLFHKISLEALINTLKTKIYELTSYFHYYFNTIVTALVCYLYVEFSEKDSLTDKFPSLSFVPDIPRLQRKIL